MADKTLDQTPLVDSLSDSGFIAVSLADKMKHIRKDQFLAPVNAAINVIKEQVLDIQNSKGQPGGFASLDNGGKVPLNQMAIPGFTFMGEWNTATNVPHLENGTGEPGQFYVSTENGTVDFGDGPIDFHENDKVMYGGDGKWVKYIETASDASANLIEFTEHVPFDRMITIMAPKTVEASLTMIPNTTGALPGAMVLGTIIANGSDEVDNTAFDTLTTSGTIDNTAGAVNKVFWWYDGTDYMTSVGRKIPTPPPGPPVTGIALTFQADQSGLNVLAGGTIQGTGTDYGGYGNTGQDVQIVPAGTNCYIRLRYTGSETEAIVLGVKTTAGRPTPSYGTVLAGVLFGNGPDTVGKVTSGAAAAVTDSQDGVVGTYYALKIEATTFKIVKTTDKITYTDVDTVAVARPGGDLYIVCCIGGDRKIVEPEYELI